ncbi:unnamed protein product [Gadus morhua 'NCC']
MLHLQPGHRRGPLFMCTALLCVSSGGSESWCSGKNLSCGGQTGNVSFWDGTTGVSGPVPGAKTKGPEPTARTSNNFHLHRSHICMM